MLTHNKLEHLYKSCKRIPIDSCSKIIVLSDCHRGSGNNGDNFYHNETIYSHALNYYDSNGYTYIELGDGDELWENRSPEQIIQTHPAAFECINRFYCNSRFYMLYGNHDIVKRKDNYIKKHYSKHYINCTHCFKELFPSLTAYEALLLVNEEDNTEIFLVHGHQGDLINDTLWMLGRFLVRYVWHPLELVGFTAPVGSTRKHKSKSKIEKRLSDFAVKKNIILIAGHTHRPYFSNTDEGKYFNSGSCIEHNQITGIEICKGGISLIEWTVGSDKSGYLFIKRSYIHEPANVNDYFNA